jgi:O-antigen/teichoic acid export membrane protein
VRRAIGSLSFRVDTVFLGVMRSATEVGLYGTVYTLMDGVLMLPTVVTGSMGPTLSANFAQGRHEVVGRLYRRGLKYLVLSGLFLAAVFAVLADSVVEMLYGPEYARSAAALRILSISVVFVFVRRQATEVLDNVDLRSATAWIFAAGLAMNVLLNFVLVPPFGYLGAAAATVVTEGYLMGAMLWALHRASYRSAWLRSFGAPALAITIGAVPMWLLRENPFVAVVLSAVVYLGALTGLRVWDDKDRLVLKGIAAKVGSWAR